MKKAICPVCWHEETHDAIRHSREVVHDDAHLMAWKVRQWENGWWECGKCGVRLTPRMAALLIDAVLRVSDPDSDSYDEEEHVFKDSVVAAKGGSSDA